MRFRSVTRFLSDQLDAAGDALLPLALAVLLTAVVTWLLTRRRYRGRLAEVEAALAEREAARAASWSSVAATVSTDEVEESKDEGRARRKALRTMTNAVDGADLALRSGDADQLDQALPNMWLALATARSVFELPVPAQGEDAHANLVAGKQWLEHVRPALRTGDDEAARRAAADFLSSNGLQQG